MDLERLYVELKEWIETCLEDDLTPLPYEQLLEFYKTIRTLEAHDYLIKYDELVDLILKYYDGLRDKYKRIIPMKKVLIPNLKIEEQ